MYKNEMNLLNKDFSSKTFFIIKKFGFSKFILIGFLIISSLILELLSIGLIIPVISILQDENFLKNFFNENLYILSLDHSQQIFLIIIVLFSIFLLKFFFLIILNYYQNKYTSFLQATISLKLMDQYIFMPYKNYFLRNSSEFIRNIKDESGSFVYGVISPILNILIELLVVIGIVSLLVITVGVATFYIIFILLIFLLIYIICTKKIISKLGNDRFNFDQKIIKNSSEIFQNIRDIKIYFLQNEFLKNYENSLFSYAGSVKNYLTFQNLPRFTIEIILVFCFCLIMLILNFKEYNFEEIIVTLGFIAVASFRLLPSFNRLISSQQVLRYHIPSVFEVYREVKKSYSKNKKKLKNINFEKFIHLKKINYSYDKKNNVLSRIDLKIKLGEKIGLIGNTGSGKSTLIDIITGLISPVDGELIIDHKKINFSKEFWGKNIGCVSQGTFLLNDTIKSNITFGQKSTKSDHKRIYEVLNDVDLDEYLKRSKSTINSIVGEGGINLSGGQKQRLGLARALYNNPKLLILDEAFSALDEKTEKKIIKKIFLKYTKMTIINIAHKGMSLRHCDKIYSIKNNKINLIK